MGALAALIKVLPELLALLVTLQKKIDEAEAQRKISDDLKSIDDAFKSNDPSKLNHIFNGTSASVSK